MPNFLTNNTDCLTREKYMYTTPHELYMDFSLKNVFQGELEGMKCKTLVLLDIKF